MPVDEYIVAPELLVNQVASPLDPAARVFLKNWAHRALTVNVDVVEHAEEAASADSFVTPSLALVLRKRGAHALVEYYNRMTEAAADESSPVPLGLAQLVEAIEPADRVEWLDRIGTPSAPFTGEQMLPLPANGEQREIIDRLAGDSGVVVEGPPGTGNTHTIANVVAALLARGQCVLVTSEKAQAPRVLRDKLPSGPQELCVAITDPLHGGTVELTRRVSEIAIHKAQFNVRRVQERIDELTTQRNDALDRRTTLVEQIRQARAEETDVHVDIAAGYEGTAASIVRRVRTQEPKYGWLPAPLVTDTLDEDEQILKARH